MIGLASCLISRAELFFLLADHIAALIGPLRCLLLCLTGAVHYIIAALFQLCSESLPGLSARLRCIQNSRHCSQAKSCQKPNETIAVTVRHINSSRPSCLYRMVQPLWGKYNYGGPCKSAAGNEYVANAVSSAIGRRRLFHGGCDVPVADELFRLAGRRRLWRRSRLRLHRLGFDTL